MITEIDRSWVAEAKHYGRLGSDDLDHPVGVVFTFTDGWFIVRGANRLPTPDKSADRRTRPGKYPWMIHAEMDAIANANRRGVSLEGSTLYMEWFPCAPCAAMLCALRIARLVGSRPDYSNERYHFREAEQMLRECGVVIDFLDD